MKKQHVIVATCFFLFLCLFGIIQAQSNFTAETKMFVQEWKQYKQKSTNNTIEDLQDRYGIRKVENSVSKSDEWLLPVTMVFESEEAMNDILNSIVQQGFLVQTKLKTICTGLIPADKTNVLSELKGLIQVQSPRKVKRVLDNTRKTTKSDSVNMGAFKDADGVARPYKGEGTIIGIIDGGFDYTHPAFYDIDDNSIYRVKKVWDQNKTGGTPPSGYGYGSEYKTKTDILNAKYCVGGGSHATHVSSIAAGSGAGTSYVGMAPKAEMLFVSTNFYDKGILDALKYVEEYSKSVDKPCVVNLSLGGHTGPHDGTSSFDLAVGELKRPGFVVVGAAGNEGEDNLYLSHTFTPNTKDTLFYTLVNFNSSYDSRTEVDIWTEENKAVKVSVALVKNGNILSKTKIVSSDDASGVKENLKDAGLTKATVEISPEQNPINNKQRLYVYVNANSASQSTYKIMVIVQSKNTKENVSIQMWNNNGIFTDLGYANNDNPIKKGNTTHTVGEIGGTSKDIISAGAYVTRTKYTDESGQVQDYGNNLGEIKDIASFSSMGPTADGRIKPDITAPGAVIVSAYNSYDNGVYREDLVQKVLHNGRSYHFGAMSGTSMATPATTGIIALFLQAHPQWQVDSVKKYLALASINDDFTGSVRNNPSNIWGVGKIDALNTLRMSIASVNPDPDPDPEPEPTPEVSVSTISELLSKQADNSTIYLYTGKATVTMIGTQRNQKWIQDATGAILIDDEKGIITTECSISDAITKLKGKLYNYQGLLEVIPTENITKTTGAPAINPQEVKISDLLNSTTASTILSKLIKIKNITFKDDGVFANGKKYIISDGTNSDSILYTTFYGVDYIGTDIPDSANITGIAVLKNGKYYISARNKTDIEVLEKVGKEVNKTITTVSVSPNPNDGNFSVNIPEKGKMQISIMDNSGRCIEKKTVYSLGSSIEISVPNPNPGLYFLQIEAKKIVYVSKIVIR